MEKGKDFVYRGVNLKNTYAQVLLEKLAKAGWVDLVNPPDIESEEFSLVKKICETGLLELKQGPVGTKVLVDTYKDLSRKVYDLIGESTITVKTRDYPMKINYMSERDIDNLIGKDKTTSVKDGNPSDIRVAHTDYGNFIVSVKGDILGIADKEALKKLKTSKDHFIEFRAHENIAVKVDPIEEKVRKQMEKEEMRDFDPKNNASSVSQDAKTGETTYTVNGEKHDPVYHPVHYCTKDLYYIPAECIQVSRLLSFSLGNVIKYIWRMGRKGNAVEDAKKACWYLEDAFKYPTKTGYEQKALGILSVLGGNDIVDNMKIVLMQDIINAFIDGVHMDQDKEIHNRIMNIAQSIKD